MPTFPGIVGALIFFLNIFGPGSGTALAAFLLWCVARERGSAGDKCKRGCTLYCVAVLQCGLSLFLIGWIWSVWWGYKLFQKSGSNNGDYDYSY